MFKRIIMAAAGYMAYRWWNKPSGEAPSRKTKDARVPAAVAVDSDIPRRN